MYLGGNNDSGVNDPRHTWLIYNNTFVNVDFNMGSPSGFSEYYDFYVRNNVFYGTGRTEKAPVTGHVHMYSNNGYYNSGTPIGSANVTSDPLLDAMQNVTSTAYVNAGTASISPALTLATSSYTGIAPDIGRTER
jgi:hypothetical protein